MSIFPTRQIFLQLGPVAIHWYGVMYLLAFIVVLSAVPKLKKYRDLPLSAEYVSNLLLYGIVGTIVGGRLGYVLFYGSQYYGSHPLEIVMIWKGGMSSHGGFIGVAVAGYVFCRRYAINFWKLADILVVPVAIGLALGRFGNFINQELYGPVTGLPWGIAIPGVEGLRHPTQLYAVFKDLLIAGLSFIHLRHSRGAGGTLGLFLVLYGIFRFLIEYVRIETAPGINLAAMHLTRGQVLTIPLMIIGICVIIRAYRRRS